MKKVKYASEEKYDPEDIVMDDPIDDEDIDMWPDLDRSKEYSEEEIWLYYLLRWERVSNPFVYLVTYGGLPYERRDDITELYPFQMRLHGIDQKTCDDVQNRIKACIDKITKETFNDIIKNLSEWNGDGFTFSMSKKL